MESSTPPATEGHPIPALSDQQIQRMREVLEGKERIHVKKIALSPCGHGYRVMRWEAEDLLGKPLEFPVATMVELLERYIRDGSIQVTKDAVQGPFTKIRLTYKPYLYSMRSFPTEKV